MVLFLQTVEAESPKWRSSSLVPTKRRQTTSRSTTPALLWMS
jgi:hypothetical protein